MSLVAWLILGLIAGFIGSKIASAGGQGMVIDTVFGVVGAFVGGFLATTLRAASVTGLNLDSLIVAVIGSIVVLALYHAAAGRNHTTV